MVGLEATLDERRPPELLIVRGAFVLDGTTGPLGSLVPDGAVLVRNRTIEAVGPFDDIVRLARRARIVGRETDLVLPGFVNSHSHGWGLSGLQLGAPDDRLEPWLIDLISLPLVDPYYDTMWSAMKLVRSGVTSVQHSGFTRDPRAFADEARAAIKAYQDLGLRVVYAVQVRDQNSYVYQDDASFLATLPADLADRVRSAEADWGVTPPDEAFALVTQLAEEHAGSDMVVPAICAEGPEWCSRQLLEEVGRRAAELELRIHMHSLESPLQRAYLQAELGRPLLEHLDALGLLGARTSIAHAVWLSEPDIALCAARGVTVCHCPSSNLRLRNGILPLDALTSAGVTVALGLDSSALNDDDDFLQEMRLAAYLHRLPDGTEIAPAPTAEAIVAMATGNGARAAGLDGITGRLAPGLKADIVTIDLHRASLPYTDSRVSPLEVLVHRARRDCVRDVVIDGRVVFTDGRFAEVSDQFVSEMLRDSARVPSTPRHAAWRDAMAELRPHAAAFFAETPWQAIDGPPSYCPNAPRAER